MFKKIRHAGAAFLGAYCPEAVGDYIAGPNHVLPTGRTARFASGLSVFDFLKRTTWVECDRRRPGPQSAPPPWPSPTAEGFTAHAQPASASAWRFGPRLTEPRPRAHVPATNQGDPQEQVRHERPTYVCLRKT